ncbi:hypothetical protein [Bacillus sp. OAE603]|uniref:hypothetical protein n=1 Tax=Gottfriedia sp. OAE603 TaxID=2663872 RepID=UPI00178BAC0F
MKKYLPIVLLILVMLTGCNSDSVYTPPYDGKNLVIGVIGNFPKVREDNVKFKKINFNKIEEEKNLSSKFDAIFIMKEHLSEAANNRYAAVYKNSGIPFFFIESKKSYLAFVNEQFSYESAPDLGDPTYATGIYHFGKGKYQYCGYGLYNDKVNENNIKDVYSRIFTTTESGKCY